MRVSASIMAHPDRSEFVEEILTTLDRPVPVAWDAEGPPSGKGDRVWRTARAAWEMFDPGADFHVLIQDDALVCRDYLAGMERALKHVPEFALVSTYLGRGRNVPSRWNRMAERADSEGASWVRSWVLMWGVSMAVPTVAIPEMIRWCDRKAGMPDDMRVGKFFQRQHIDTWYAWPSLVDHRPAPSLTKHRQVERVAVRHHAGSALDLDWSGPTVVDPMIIRHRGPQPGPLVSSRKR